MWEWLLKRTGPRYILAMMLLTRVVGALGGVLTIYYVFATLSLKAEWCERFFVSAMMAIAAAIVTTSVQTAFETVNLRRVLRKLRSGETPQATEFQLAGREAVGFAANHHVREALVVPAVTTLPVCYYMRELCQLPLSATAHIAIATFLGIATSLLLTFFAVRIAMEPVIRELLRSGLSLSFDELPQVRLRTQFNICFGMVLLIGVTMIAALAHRRIQDIAADPENYHESLRSLQWHAVVVALIAVGIGGVILQLLSKSLTDRVAVLTGMIEQVRAGDFTLRIAPVGTDEIDLLSRRFNEMIDQLDRKDRTVRDLNINLEQLVAQRTRQLQASLVQLQEAMKDLRSTQDRLIQSEKMSSLGQLVAGVAHEINNSINAVYNGVPSLITRISRVEKMIEEELEADAIPTTTNGPTTLVRSRRPEIRTTFLKIHQLAEVVSQGADRTARIVRDMKSFSHPGRTDDEQLDINHTLDICLNLLATSNIVAYQVIRDFGALPVLTGPYSQLNQVFMNLLSNAIQAISDPAMITQRQPEIRITTHRDGNFVFVTIRDNGPGVPEKNRGRIFDPFFTTKPVGVGTGMGLSISYGIVIRLGGTIECRSEAGQGAEFTVAIPVVPARPVAV